MNKERWLALMKGLELPPSLDIYEALWLAYNERHRHYHTTKHIEAMLLHFDTVSNKAVDGRELELAIWFHDAVYKPLSSNNELDSAKWAEDFLQKNNYSDEGIKNVFRMIMATKHNVDVTGNDDQLLVDIDLTILGAPKHIYDQFEENVRKEYKMVPSLIYRKKRKEILQYFLDKENIYNFDHFQNKLEKVARDNLRRAIEGL